MFGNAMRKYKLLYLNEFLNPSQDFKATDSL
jgi:hypothetical protein